MLNAAAQRKDGFWLCVMVHWIGNEEHALTPSPSPTERGRGGADRFLSRIATEPHD